MLAIRAIRETEGWTTSSILVGVLLLVAVLAFVGWRLRRFLNDDE